MTKIKERDWQYSEFHEFVQNSFQNLAANYIKKRISLAEKEKVIDSLKQENAQQLLTKFSINKEKCLQDLKTELAEAHKKNTMTNQKLNES